MISSSVPCVLFNVFLALSYSETGYGGGQNVPNARGGGGTRPESCPLKTWTFDPQIGDFLENLCRKGSISGAPGHSTSSEI